MESPPTLLPVELKLLMQVSVKTQEDKKGCESWAML